jgi:glycosyltransferase involved in cell wall biosynthesis
MPADVWHAHDFNTLGLAAALARRHGGSLVYDAHEIFAEAGATSALPSIVRWAIRNREREWAREADAVLTVNDSLADHLGAEFGMNLTVVRNCALVPTAVPSPLRHRLGLAPSDRLAIYHGSVTQGRGLEQLVASMSDSRLATTHLAIMGYGHLRPRIQQLAAASAARDRITFLPPVPPSEVTSWVAGADVAVMPIEPTTLNHRLSSPNKLFEAIAAGVPVVGPDFVEFRRFVLKSAHGALGRLHASHDAGSIAGAVDDLLSLAPAQRRAMRARCRAASRQWNWRAEARMLRDVYAGLVTVPAASRTRLPAPLTVAEE